MPESFDTLHRPPLQCGHTAAVAAYLNRVAGGLSAPTPSYMWVRMRRFNEGVKSGQPGTGTEITRTRIGWAAKVRGGTPD